MNIQISPASTQPHQPEPPDPRVMTDKLFNQSLVRGTLIILCKKPHHLTEGFISNTRLMYECFINMLLNVVFSDKAAFTEKLRKQLSLSQNDIFDCD